MMLSTFITSDMLLHIASWLKPWAWPWKAILSHGSGCAAWFPEDAQRLRSTNSFHGVERQRMVAGWSPSVWGQRWLQGMSDCSHSRFSLTVAFLATLKGGGAGCYFNIEMPGGVGVCKRCL